MKFCGKTFREAVHLPKQAYADDAHVQKIKDLVRSNSCLTVKELAEVDGISIGSCRDILTEKLNMHGVAVKFVPHLMAD